MAKYIVRSNNLDVSRLVARSGEAITSFDLVKIKKDLSVSDTKTVMCYLQSDKKALKLTTEKGNLINLTIDKNLGWFHKLPTKTVKNVGVTDTETLENIIDLAHKANEIFTGTLGCDWLSVVFDIYYKVHAKQKTSVSFEIITCGVIDWIDAIEYYSTTHNKEEVLEVVELLSKVINWNVPEREEFEAYFAETLVKTEVIENVETEVQKDDLLVAV